MASDMWGLNRVLTAAGRRRVLAPITGSSPSVEPRGRDGHLGEFTSSAVLTAIGSGRLLHGFDRGRDYAERGVQCVLIHGPGR
jgi:hypothetical protein